MGAGAVFLNSNFERYILADVNPDLINVLFNIVKEENVEGYEACKPIFFADDANANYYYAKRRRFNASTDPFERSIIFLYLNRFGFNGLCRYNSRMNLMCLFGAYTKLIIFQKIVRYFAHKKHKVQCFML